MGIELTPAAKALLGRARATTRCWAPGRCAAPSSARSRTRCRRRSCSASSARAQIVVVDTEGEGDEQKFTFAAQPKSNLPEIATPADIPEAVVADVVGEPADARPNDSAA